MSHATPEGSLHSEQRIPISVFGLINQDPVSWANFLQNFLVVGSKTNNLSIDDITMVTRDSEVPSKYDTVQDAIQHGTRLFDAMAYFSLPESSRPPISSVPLPAGENDPTLTEIARSLLYYYFFLITRANIPGTKTGANVQPTPRFLTLTLGFTKDQTYYTQQLASFGLDKIDPRWIKHVTFDNLGTETKNRIGLGVAGYRLATMLFYDTHDKTYGEDVAAALRSVKVLVDKGPVWEIHPITRSADFLFKVKNFNKNINNLLTFVYTEAMLQKMVTLMKLNSIPLFDAGFQEWKTWTLDSFAAYNDYVFPQSRTENPT